LPTMKEPEPKKLKYNYSKNLSSSSPPKLMQDAKEQYTNLSPEQKVVHDRIVNEVNNVFFTGSAGKNGLYKAMSINLLTFLNRYR
jgi:hypothetical protein